jgi:hypothetical protein
MKQNPFSLYDFLGYFIPGAFTICLFHAINLCKDWDITSLSELITNYESLFCSYPNLSIGGAIFLLIFSYVIGNMFSFISSITVEKYAVMKYDYPSRFLLKLKSKYPNRFKKDKHWLQIIQKIILTIVLCIILLPIIISDFLFGKIFGLKDFYSKPLEETLIKLIMYKISRLEIKLGITEDNGFDKGEIHNCDFYRIIQHYTFENSKEHQAKFTNYVALYGFLRTFALIFNITFWYLLIHITIWGHFDLSKILLIIFTGLISYIFFMAFMKFYRRYTLEGLMVLSINTDLDL